MALQYELLGRRVEDMPTSLNYEVESIKDVRGVTDTSAVAGSCTTEISPVVVNKNSTFARFIDTAVERDYELSQLEREFLVVRLFKRHGDSYERGNPAAYKQKAIVVPGEYASENKGLHMSATLNWIGEKTYGEIDLTKTIAAEKFKAVPAKPVAAKTHYKDGDAGRNEFQIFFAYDDAETL